MPEKLKDVFFTRSSVGAMATAIKRAYPKFDKKRFLALVLDDEFEGKELKARMHHVAECLQPVLPRPYRRALAVLEKSAPHVKGFEAMCLPDFVELYGRDDWDASLSALALFTRYSSSEFAIRPFIIEDPRRAMAFMVKLAASRHEKVRRFASEGCRPRLPWAMAIPAFKKDPVPILPVLERLKDDESELVRRSVANNLNDISKDNSELVLDLCESWHGKSSNTDWIIKHACRTLLKAGNRRAMMLFGFGDPRQMAVEKLKFDRARLGIGDRLQFSFTLRVDTKKKCKARLEYAVYFAKARGKVSKKVFKITENSYAPGDHGFTRKHSFADMSTRKHYPGKHELAVVVNGVEKARKSLTLRK